MTFCFGKLQDVSALSGLCGFFTALCFLFAVSHLHATGCFLLASFLRRPGFFSYFFGGNKTALFLERFSTANEMSSSESEGSYHGIRAKSLILSNN